MEPNTFSHQCIDGVCHCDFRLSIYQCIESNVLYDLFFAALIMASINSIIGIGILIQRLVLQSQSVFDKRSLGNRFFIRPRPIDSLFFFTTLFSTLWVIDFIILLMDILPNYHALRSILFDLPLQLCTDTCSLYMLSLLQRFSQTETIENEGHHQVEWWWWHWLGIRSPVTVNLIWLERYCGIMLIIFPFIVNNSLSLVIGALADHGRINTAEHMTRLHFGLWTMTSSTVWFLFIYSLQRINRLYPSSLSIHSNPSLQISFYRNKMFLTTLNYCSGLFVFLFLFYCLFRSTILRNTPILLTYCSCWIFVPLVTQLALQVTYIVHPQTLLLSMLKVKGFEDYPVGIHQQQSSSPQHQKEIETEHSFTSGIPSSIRPPSISPHVYAITAATMNHLKQNSNSSSSSSPSPSPPPPSSSSSSSPIYAQHQRPTSPDQSGATNQHIQEDGDIAEMMDDGGDSISISSRNRNITPSYHSHSTSSHSTSSPLPSTNSLVFDPSSSTSSATTTLSKLPSDIILKK